MNWQTIVQQNNLAVSSVKYSDLNEETRLDAEYHRPEAIRYLELIEKKNDKTLADVAKFVVGPFGSTVTVDKYVDDADYCYVRNLDINSFEINNPEAHIPQELYEKLKQFHIMQNDLLVTVVGTLGKVAIAQEKDTKSIFSCKSTIIRSDSVDPYFLATFLNSSVGQTLLLRCKRGAIQEGLNLFDLKTLPVAIPSEDLQIKIRKMIDDAFTYSTKGIDDYRLAEQLLLADLNLADYNPPEVNSSTRNLSDCLADDRFDAEYWQPKYDEIRQRVASVPQSKLGQLVNHKKGIEVGSEAYQDEGKSFIRVSDFSTFGIEDVEKKISEELYESLKKSYEPKRGEVLFTKDGTIGLSFALNEDIEGILSGAFLRLQPKVDLNTNYLALVLNSPYCKAQIERMSGGAIIAHLKPESAMQISIPVLSKERQLELGEMVIKSLQMRKEAKNLLEKAKRAVEVFVEQDEAQALAYLAS